MADDNINNGSSDEQLPEDLRRLLDRAQADDSGEDVYDPDAEGEDTEDDDDGELEEEFGDGGRGEATGETDEHGGTLQISEFGHEMRQSFIEYSMSVITARALPDVRDGLKPVHRRILYAMNESGIFPNRPHKKSAWTVGEVIGKYHPHGDSAVYEAMVRLAQWFSVRTPLVDGHGNFGNIDGDGAAAMRYTESRLAKPAMELLRDLQKDTVDWQPNYDESLQEPQVLPARFPNLLVNGSSGIAVGMATNIPPHNLGEAVEATCMLIDNPDATVDELMTVMPGPDFPTGAVIMGTDGIREAYETGRGSITVRAKAHVETTKTGRSRLVFTEIPYQVNKGALQEKIAQLVNEKRIEGVSDMRDESNQKGIRLVIELKKDIIPQVVLNNLYKFTQLQTTFGVNNLALVHGVPKCLSLREILQNYIEHQVEVVTRRTRFDLKKAQARAHILEGYLMALDNIDEVIHIIRSSETDKEAAARLTERFGLSEKQTNAILEMRLRRLTGLERTKIEEELAELREKIAYYKQILADENLLKQVIREELQEIKKKYNTPRRTRLTGEAKDIEVEDLIAEENMVVTMTKAGYIKRLPVSTYRQQKRGGKGMQGVNLKDADFVEHLFVASTHSYMLFFSTKGKVYRLKVYEIPEAGRHARGTAIVNLLPLEKGESISAVIATKDFPAEEFLMFATAQGNVKKTSMDQYDRTRRDGLIAINLKDGDELISVKRVAKGEKVIMVSSAGKAILWDESEARAMGRGTMGVRGMNVPADAHVLGMEIAKPGTDLFVITEKGYGKRTKIEEYPEHHRGGQGVYTITMTHKKGLLSVMKIVGPDDEIMIVSEDGVIVRTPVKGISELGRSTQGVKVMNVADKDKVCAVAIASTGKKKAKKAAPADENQMGLLEEESEEGTLAIDDLDDLDDDLGDEGEATEE